MRQYENMSDDELQQQILALQNKGVKPTPVTYSGLMTDSDYVSPGGRRGFTVRQNPSDETSNWIRAEKNALEKDTQTRKEYWGAMANAEDEYNKRMANANAMEQKDRLTRDLQEAERELREYGGAVPRGTKSYYGKWAGMDREPAPVEDERYKDLLRKKYAIQNALLGKGIDIGEAVPQRKGGGQLIPGPDGSLLWHDEQGGVRRVLDREKEQKEKSKPEPNFLEKEEIKSNLEILKDPTAAPEAKAAAQKYLEDMRKKYSGEAPGTGEPELSPEDQRKAQIEQYITIRDRSAEEVVDLVKKKHPKAMELVEQFKKQFPHKEDHIYMDTLLEQIAQGTTQAPNEGRKIADAITAESETEKARRLNEAAERASGYAGRVFKGAKSGEPGYKWLIP